MREPIERLWNRVKALLETDSLTKIYCAGVLLALLVLSVQARAEEIVILSWEKYFAPEVISDFHRETGIQIRTRIFETDEERSNILSQDLNDVDIVVIDRTDIPGYRDIGWLQTIDWQRLKNLHHLDSGWHTKEYEGVAYSYGSTGIAYRTDLVSRPPTSWRDIYIRQDPQDKPIGIINEVVESFGSALKSTSQSIRDIGFDDIDTAFDVLSQNRHNHRYIAFELNENNPLVSGETPVAMAYNGDVVYLRENLNAKLAYVYPEEGCLLWADYLTISARTRKLDAVYRFLDYMLLPEVALKNTMHIKFSTPNAGAVALLPEAVRNNRILYPHEADTAKCEFFRPQPEAITSELNQAFFIINHEKR